MRPVADERRFPLVLQAEATEINCAVLELIKR